MKAKSNQKGFGAVEGLLTLVILGLIGGVGYYVYSANKPDNSQQTAAPSAKNSSDAPEIKNTEDLDKASKSLDDSTNENDVNEAKALETEVTNL